jgi:hypothetical protein
VDLPLPWEAPGVSFDDEMTFDDESRPAARSSEAETRGQLMTGSSWPIASTTKAGFGATQARRLLAAVEINDRTGADRPRAEFKGALSGRRKLSFEPHEEGLMLRNTAAAPSR